MITKDSSSVYALFQNIRFPSEKAHSIYVAKSGAAVSKLGFTSKIVVPNYANHYHVANLWKHYQIPEDTFAVVRVFGIQLRLGSLLARLVPYRFHYPISVTAFIISCFFWTIWQRPKIIQTGVPEFLLILPVVRLFYQPQIILDLHIDPPPWLSGRVFNQADLIVVNCLYFKTLLLKRNVRVDKILNLPNGIDIKFYQLAQPNGSLPDPKKELILNYVGRFETLGKEKGIFTLLETLSVLKKIHIPAKAYIVGGPEAYIFEYERFAHQIGLDTKDFIFKSQVTPEEVPQHLKYGHLGWLVYPDNEHFRYKMSPMKLMEYFAVGMPVIASNFESLTEFFPPGLMINVDPTNITSIVAMIQKYYHNPQIFNLQTQQAKAYASHYSWPKRQ